ncbi:SLBB domain-containing protein [Gammaproteobacteria bacterium]|nr:SLBB domain-containing protein [Gammaproteobacteria bacterium]
MNKFLVTTLLITSAAIFSQELDESYLKSLPDNIREDVLLKIDQRDEDEKPIYRRQSSMIDKPFSEEEMEARKKRNRFGDNIFDTMQSSFMPINEPNLDSSYVLDFGDTLELQLIGQKNSIDNLSVKRDGSINIPEIGKLFVSGLPLDDVNKLIKAKISAAFIGVEAFITLVNIRDIQVLVTGNAYNPGIYTLNGNSNILNALSMAGGVDINGSFRKIDLIRNNEVIKSVDLYDIFIYGKSGFGERLRSGDSIIVRPSMKMVTISGAVKRPALYELTEDNNFSDLIDYGDGFADNANLETLRIERPLKDDTSFIDILDLDELSNIDVRSSDRLNVRAFDRRTVTISGAINTPGVYTISKGETLSSLISKAQGYKDNAYPFGGILINETALALNVVAAEKLYKSFVQRLVTKGDALFASESLPFILDELKKTEISGRVMAEFDLDVIEANKDLDTTLDNNDQIIIPIKSEQVYIFGEVNQPGAIRYKPSKSVTDYIAGAGGAIESSDVDNTFVIHPNGEVNRISNVSRLSILNNRNNEILIYPGSVIYIPREVKSRDASMTASIWAPIVSSAATSITALSVLNSN